MGFDSVYILLVEDNPDHAFLIEERLNEAGFLHKITHAETVAKALGLLEGATYDVILLDLALPDSVGLETVKFMYQRAGDTPIVVTSGNDDDRVASAAIEAGAQDFLTKAETQGRAIARCIRQAIERKNRTIAERKQERLQEMINAMQQVLGVVSHELRTPLASIRALVELVLDGGVGIAERRDEFLRSVRNESVRMSELLDNLLEVARLNSGLARWHWDDVRFDTVCEEAVSTVLPLLNGPEVDLRLSLPDHEVRMLGDHHALRRLLVNLLTNSIKHTHRGRIDLSVAYAEGSNGKWISVSVTDTGEGIAPHMLDKLGQAFALNSGMVGADHVKGSGLGLAICKGIIAAHGGTVSIDSKVGRGTTIGILLRSDLSEPSPVQRLEFCQSGAV